MRSAVAHVVALVVGLMFVGVACMPARLENTIFLAEEAAHHIQRRAPGHPSTVQDNSTLCGNATVCVKADDNSTITSNFNAAKNFLHANADLIYRAMVVLGSVSLIVLVYISFRYFRHHWQKSKSRKYGLITMPDDKLELKPLEEDDEDDEDMTVFDRTKSRAMNSQTAPLRKSAKQF